MPGDRRGRTVPGMRDTLTALDATFLELEELDEGALMSIGGIMVFDPRPDGSIPTVEQVRTQLAPRLAALPRYTQRLSQTHLGRLSWPRWVDDARFDIAGGDRLREMNARGAVERVSDVRRRLWTLEDLGVER